MWLKPGKCIQFLNPSAKADGNKADGNKVGDLTLNFDTNKYNKVYA